MSAEVRSEYDHFMRFVSREFTSMGMELPLMGIINFERLFRWARIIAMALPCAVAYTVRSMHSTELHLTLVKT